MTANLQRRGLLASAAALITLAAVGRAQAPPADPVAAVVNGEQLHVSEIEAVIKMLPAPPTTPTELQRRQVRREALEMLTDDVLMRQFLQRNGRPVNPAEVNQRLRELENALKTQKRTLTDFLKETAQTEDHLRQDVAKKLQWDDFVTQRLTETSLRRYYDENRDFYDQVTVKASHILLRVPLTAGEAECQTARGRLNDLRQQILAGQLDFAAAARKHSQCASAPQGGDIGYFPRKWAVDENVARAAFALKPGEVSEVIRTDYGFHLIKATDRKPGLASEFEKIKDEVRENYAMELWQTILTQQRKLARIDITLP